MGLFGLGFFLLSETIALRHLLGMALTIGGVVTVMIIPFSILLYKEKINLREIVGVIIAVTGTAIMFS